MFTSASPTVIRRFCAIAIEDDRNEYSRAFAHVKLGDRLSERSRNHRTLIFLARYFFRRKGKKGKIPGEKREKGERRRETLSQLIKRRIDRWRTQIAVRLSPFASFRFRAAESVVPSVIRRQKYFAIYFHPVFIPRRRQVRYLRQVQDAGEPECCDTWQAQFIGNNVFSRSCALLTSSPSFPRRMRERKVEA